MRVKIVNAPGYTDEWEAELIDYLRTVDGRAVAVVDSGGEWHVIERQHVREVRNVSGGYAECGCIAPCPDHVTPSQTAKDDRAYWDDKYADERDTDNDE